jgi:hypothetical protein
MKKIILLTFSLIILNGCGPVKVEGDVFLVKGDGKPQPSAAKEVIFIKAESFEDLLIETYLETIQTDLDSSNAKLKTICSNASDLIQTKISELESVLDISISEQKASGITDQNGSCNSMKITFDEASLVASSSRNQFSKLIAEQRSKIQEAKENISNLESTLETKITNKEKALYEDFFSGIKVALVRGINQGYSYGDPGWVIAITNNTNKNIKLEGDICYQYFNAEGDPVGHTSTASSLGECDNYYPEYRAQGTVLRSSAINNMNLSKDEFGFDKGGFLSPGQTSKQPTSDDKSYFCGRSLSPSETMRMTNKYGNDKSLWPDLTKPDQSMGYKVLPGDPELVKSYDGDESACGVTMVGAKFIALEPEVRTVSGDTVSYSSESINFRQLAEEIAYPERSLIEDQEEIINAADLEIVRLNDLSRSDPFIRAENNAEEIMTSCKTATAGNEMLKESISQASLVFDNTESCSLNDGNIFDSLMSVALRDEDINQLEMLMSKNYSTEAAIAMMMKFADSEYVTSTNISGHYMINEIPKGNYVVYSSYADNFNSGIYLDDIEIAGEAQIDLSNTKFLSIYSLESLINTFYENCSEIICTDSDLRYTLGVSIDRAEQSYKDLKEAEEDLQETLRELERLLGG